MLRPPLRIHGSPEINTTCPPFVGYVEQWLQRTFQRGETQKNLMMMLAEVTSIDVNALGRHFRSNARGIAFDAPVIAPNGCGPIGWGNAARV